MPSSRHNLPIPAKITTGTISLNLEKPKRMLSSKSHHTMKRSTIQSIGTMNLVTVIACSLCLLACLFPARPVECGRLQDFIQNLVGGGSNSNSNNNNSNKENSNSNSNSNSNNNNNDNSDSDTAATNDNNDQPLTPMMSAMSPFMRYPSF